ncbi:shikimate dehydrogenase family protein [Vulcanisaeta distributa]|uniref:Shikimate dehydrogenase (NADP(+)) n=1 Tax=Vulcanisaeta distributa (strain DSM 14429 / JCM 11212 / NBRC 100878 / IC-017) TaxID=572478 RepID=E1QT37_VULDI|nr:shikimate dehydrogenase [Vulcanisaeta distributa]ADN49629.1 shikimate 5-dehydrogenase [Vulcanisaeta distributa DSM 14429]
MQVYAVIGYPLDYTLSPNIHNYVFRELGVDAVYVPLKVSPDRLGSFVDFARDSLSGFNVTIPHKVAIVRLIDGVVGPARELGSVNTVVNRGGELLGYNTDYIAIKQALSDRGYSGGDALIIGAGGVARAVALALRDLGCSRVYVMNRTVERGRELCSLINSWGIDCVALDFQRNINIKARLLVNATPLGVNGDFPIDPGSTGAGLVLDLAYKPSGITGLIRLARERSIPYIDGLEILVRQAIEADRIWLGPFEEPTWYDVLEKLRDGLI